MKVYQDNFKQGIDGHNEVHLRTDINGNSRFGKATTVNEYQIDWKSPWKELFCLKVYKYMGIVDLSPSIEIINGLLHLDRIDIPLNWNAKIENPNLVVMNEEEFFCNLLICDTLVKHQNRSKGKNEHIGLLPVTQTDHLGAPIDNEASLEDLESEITIDWVEAFFSSDFVKTREVLIKNLEKLKTLPIISISAETTEELVSKGNFNTQKANEICEFGARVAFQVKERIQRTEEILIHWFDNKFNGQSAEQLEQQQQASQNPI